MSKEHNFDFTKPQKLEKKALWIVLGKAFWDIGKALWPILVIIAIKGPSKNAIWFYLIFIGIAILAAIRLVIPFLYYTYELSLDELKIKKGWLNKSETIVKFDKIHEVNLNQKFIHKLLGLYNVAVDTAGSSKTEIEINGVSYHKALALKDILTQRKVDLKVDEGEVEITENIVQKDLQNHSDSKIALSLSSLIKIGMTRNYLQTFGLLFAFGFQIADQLQSVFYDNDESIYDDIYTKTSEFSIGLLWIGLLFGLILFVVLFNLIRTVFTYFNYQIQLKNKHILVSYGLTDSHIISVPANKVQLFKFQQNYIQRMMNLFEVQIVQVESEDANKKRKGLIIPGANLKELSQLFRVVYSKDLNVDIKGIRPHIRSFIIKTFIWSIIFSLLIVGLFYQDQVEYFRYVCLIYIVIISLIFIGFRNRKFYIDGDFIVVKQGIWDITTTYLHISKVQQLALSQSFFQRKSQLGSLTLSTAGGQISLSYYHFPMLQKLANEWMYHIEKNKYPWT